MLFADLANKISLTAGMEFHQSPKNIIYVFNYYMLLQGFYFPDAKIDAGETFI